MGMYFRNKYKYDRHYFLHFLLAGAAGWGAANQLDYSYDDFIDTVQEEDLSKHLSASAKAAPTRVKRHKKLNVPMTDHKIKLIFNITGERSKIYSFSCTFFFKILISNTYSKTLPSVHKACWRCRQQFSGDIQSLILYMPAFHFELASLSAALVIHFRVQWKC